MFLSPPVIGYTKNLLSGIEDYVGQPRMRTNPSPAPNFSTFRSTPGGGYARQHFGSGFGKGLSQSYWWGYPVSYSWPYYWAPQYPSYYWPSYYGGYPYYYWWPWNWGYYGGY